MKDVYIGCMLIGNRFNKKYFNKDSEYYDDVIDWNGSEECSTVARLTYELMNTLNTGMEETLDYVMSIAMRGGFRNLEDHMWDDYCKGFLAGQILGMPTKENLEKAEEAEKLWKDDEMYGYYQEVLEEVK